MEKATQSIREPGEQQHRAGERRDGLGHHADGYDRLAGEVAQLVPRRRAARGPANPRGPPTSAR
jgi:hypothetical protein